MHFCLKPHAVHAQGLLDAVLVVDDELLGQDMQHLLVHGNVHGPRRVDHPRHVGGIDLFVLDGNDAAGVDALDVAAGNAYVDRIDLHARHQLGLAHRLPHGLHGAVDVDNHAFFQAVGRADPDPDDVHLARVLHRAHDGADLGRAEIESHQYVIRFFHHGFPPLVQ